MENCIFCKIARGEVSKDFLYNDDEIMAFKDINPVKPVHVLIVPKRHIPELIAVDDVLLLAKLLQVTQQLISKFEISDKGYRVIINGGGAQEIDHLHIHLMGPMGSRAAL
ncbi:MAG: histidine triad nucleotide-binding protein [Patescibacteria group bacterium]|nr:MAG: histidine triad nucleotide-binding protein [Patescibacteria group bacterium]